mmetsp:Transcript_7477/g.28102  ORF Transcript_7477/g.28102 Transcript_7477/m.28102 type:complete len:112 (+) Transcript_7477:769-1104(+)
MKTQPVNIPEFKELGNPAFAINTPPEHISLASIVLCVAKKQSGKTRFVTNLLYQLKQAGSMDRIFWISDTVSSNKKMLESLDIRPEDIISPDDPDAVDKIVAEIEKERERR